jgi:hypothetical protein
MTTEAPATTTAAVRWRDLSAALIVFAASLGFLLWARAYPPRSGAVPEMVAWATIALTLIDIGSQFETTWGRWLRRLVTAEKIVEWKLEGDEDASPMRVAIAIAWVVAYVVLLYFVGFMIATPIYTFFYMWLYGGHTLRNSVLLTAATSLTIWLTFEVFFRYPLYPGVLLGGY